MYCFEFYNCTKAQLEKRKIYGAIEENSYLKVVTSSNDSHATYKKAKGLRFICYDKKYDKIPLIDRPISATIYQMHTLLEKKEILFGGAVIAGKN